MIRDFSDEALELMLSYCNDYEEWCEEGAPEYQWDSSYTKEELDYYISNSTDAEVCMQYIDLYHQELIRSRDYTATTVEEIFQAVNDLDDGFSSVIASQTEAYYDPYISVIQGLINCLTKPEAGQSIMDAPSEFKKALDSVGNGVLEDMVAKLYPKDGDWSAIDELLAKNPEDVTPLEMEAINQIMMDNVSLDENGDIVVDEEMEELYEHFFEEKGPFNHGYYPKPLVEYIVSYQQEYSQGVANRYAYVFSIPSEKMTSLDKMKRDEVLIACAVADMTYAVYSMSEWGNQVIKLLFSSLPVVGDMKDISNPSSAIYEAYNETLESNSAIIQEIMTNNIIRFADALEGTCSIVAEKDRVSVRNIVINTDELSVKIESINQQGYNFDMDTLINEFNALCSGSMDIQNLVYFEKICLRKNDADYYSEE